MKILIIDDSPDAVAVARQRLAKEGAEILEADGGVAGLEAAKREKPDLILLDVEMPDVLGYDVCRALKADPELCMIPVIFLSGSGTAEDKVKGLDLGAVDYVTKPFDAFELRARVRAALRTKHLQDLLIEHAHIDPLTGLPNRRALMVRLQREWARMERHGGALSLIMADADHFKKVNDRYGHSIGDKLLQEIAGTIARQCRATDLPARYGGEEFAIVVPDEAASQAARLAERCRREIEKVRLPVGTETVESTASFGVADARGVPSPKALVDRADEALYRAKSAGRNCVRQADAEVGETPGGICPEDASPVGSAQCDQTTLQGGN
jgi:diguanylate cyclase (GGDEF)-like protein